MVITTGTLGSGVYANTSIKGTDFYVSTNVVTGAKYIAQPMKNAAGTSKWNLVQYTNDRFVRACRGHYFLIEHDDNDEQEAVSPRYPDKNDPKHIMDTCFRIKKDFDMKLQGYAKELQREHFCYDCKNKARFGVVITRLSVMLEHYFDGDVSWALKSCRKANLLSVDLLYIINNFQLYRKKGFLALMKKHYDNAFFIEYIKNNPKRIVYDKVSYDEPFKAPPARLGLKTKPVIGLVSDAYTAKIKITNTGTGIFTPKTVDGNGYIVDAPDVDAPKKPNVYPKEPKEAYTEFKYPVYEESKDDVKKDMSSLEKAYHALHEKYKGGNIPAPTTIMGDVHASNLASENPGMWTNSEPKDYSTDGIREMIKKSRRNLLKKDVPETQEKKSFYNQYFNLD